MLPHLHSFNNRFAGKRWYSVIDFKQAYYQIRMLEADIAKTAIRTPAGSFEYLYMPFGLRCASQTWQQCADEMFADMRLFTYVYIDDVIIYSETFEEHLEHLRSVFKRMKEYGMKINAKKSQLCKEEVTYIGFKVNKNGISPNDDKVKALLDIPEPKTYQQLKKFICAISYYHKFIPNFFKFSKVLSSIQPKTRRPKTEPVNLDDQQKAAFGQLKTMLANHVRLAHPVAGATLVLETDASGTGLGAVLYQMIDQQLEPLFFFSKALEKEQLHWDTYRRELEALYQAIRRLNKMILGNPLIVYTDNTNLLKNIQNCKEVLNPIELRKLITISQATTEVRYIETRHNVVADYLSRIPILQIYCMELSRYFGSQIRYDLLSAHQAADEWCKTLAEGPRFRHVFKTFMGKTLPFWMHIDTKGNQRFCVPTKSIKQVFEAYHNLHHPGHNRTRNLIATRFYWPSMFQNTKYLTQCCLPCQVNKFNRLQKLHINSIPAAAEKFAHINIGSVGPMPDEFVGERGHRYILTIRDQATRYLVLLPLKTLEKEETYEAIVRHYIGAFGLPTTITSDNHGQFCNHLLDYLLERLGIKHHRTLAYLPRANATIERPHSQIAGSLRCLPHSKEWPNYLPMLQLFWNNTNIQGSDYTPYQLAFGKDGRLPSDFFEPQIEQPTNSQQSERSMFDAMQRFKPAVKTANNMPQPTFILKDLAIVKRVWVRDFARAHKYQQVFKGPYEVLERHDHHYVLKNNDGQPMKRAIIHLRPTYEFNPSLLWTFRSKRACEKYKHT